MKPDSFHELIGDEQYSIFTYAQARSFDEGDFRIVTISKALGYDRAEQSIKAFMRIRAGQGRNGLIWQPIVPTN